MTAARRMNDEFGLDLEFIEGNAEGVPLGDAEFDLAVSEAPCLANFLPGRNAELLAVLPAFIAGQHNATGMLLWGALASGKSHLLAAAVALARERGLAARYVAQPRELADDLGGADALICSSFPATNHPPAHDGVFERANHGRADRDHPSALRSRAPD